MLCPSCSKLPYVITKKVCVKCNGAIVKNIQCICTNCAIQNRICSCCLKKVSVHPDGTNSFPVRRTCKACGH